MRSEVKWQPDHRLVSRLIPDPMLVIGQDGTVLNANLTSLRKYGFKKSDLVGKNIRELDFVPPDTKKTLHNNLVSIIQAKKVPPYEVKLYTKGGEERYFEFSGYPTKYEKEKAVVALLRDITERKLMEGRLLYLNEVLPLIRQINQIIAQVDNESELLQKACAILIDSRNYKMAWFGLIAKDTYDVLPVAQAGFEEGYLSSVKITWDDSEHGQGPTGTAIRSGCPYVMQDILNDERFQPWREQALKWGYRSSAALPLMVGDKVIGALNVYSEQPNAFDDTELNLLMELAGDISVGIAKIRAREERAKALYQSEQMLYLMFESMSDGLVVSDLNVVTELSSIIIELNPRTVELHGFDSKNEVLGRNVLELIARHDHQRAKANLQKTLEQGSVRNVEYTLIKKDGSEFPGELSTSLLKDASGKAIGFITIIRDITERKKSEEQLKEAYEAIVMSMVLSLEARDPYTRGHSERVRLYCRKIAHQMGLSSKRIQVLERAASLHDIGKIAVSDTILNKPGPLTPPEFAQMQLHPEKSVDLLRTIPNPRDALLAIRHHHERVDGEGYPDGLSGDTIPLSARILAVADAYDALTSERSYRKSYSHEEALRILKNGAGSQWDAEVVKVAIRALGEPR